MTYNQKNREGRLVLERRISDLPRESPIPLVKMCRIGSSFLNLHRFQRRMAESASGSVQNKQTKIHCKIKHTGKPDQQEKNSLWKVHYLKLKEKNPRLNRHRSPTGEIVCVLVWLNLHKGYRAGCGPNKLMPSFPAQVEEGDFLQVCLIGYRQVGVA